MRPLISIIIPVYNRENLIAETLDSVLSQTYHNWECIIVDDGSTDMTKTIIQLYSQLDTRFKFYERPKTLLKGGNAARNYGFKYCEGLFVNWFDSDDIMLPDFIEAKLPYLKDDSVDMVLSSGEIIDSNKNKIGDLNLSLTSGLFKSYILSDVQIITASILFRKTFLLHKKLFNENITRGQEYEFFSRLFYNIEESNYKILNKSLFLYRQHSGTKTKLSESYVRKYKESLAFIYAQNLEMVFKIEDGRLIKLFFSLIMNLFYDSYDHKHDCLRTYILKRITKILIRNKMNLMDVILVLKIMTYFNFKSYQLYKYSNRRVYNLYK